MKMIIKVIALVLCLLFFMPFVSCGSLTGFDDGASGYEIATGTRMSNESNPIFFAMLICPVLLLVCGNFATLRNISVLGGLTIICFMIGIKQQEFGDMYRFTIFAWLTLILYLGSAIFSQYCMGSETKSSSLYPPGFIPEYKNTADADSCDNCAHSGNCENCEQFKNLT